MSTTEIINEIEKVGSVAELEAIQEATDAQAERLADIETEKRCEELASGKVQGVSHEEIFGHMRKHLDGHA
jgi:hypothetical protein